MDQKDLYNSFIECTIEYYHNRDNLISKDLSEYYLNQLENNFQMESKINAILIFEYGVEEFIANKKEK